MFDWSFGTPTFSFPSFSFTGSGSGSGGGSGASGSGGGGPISPGGPSTMGTNGGVFDKILAGIGLGLDGWKTWLGYDLANEQVQKNQYPSGPASYLGLGQATSWLGSIVPILLVVGVVFLFFKLIGSIGGRRK